MKKSNIILIIIAIICIGCKNDYQPKPRGYFRIDLPEQIYERCDTVGPYSAEFNVNSISRTSSKMFATDDDEWIDIYYPSIDATIHLSYKNISPKIFQTVTEESRSLAYKHTIRADAINEKFYQNDSTQVYCILYEMTGNAASPCQFYLTDSTRHFLRGALYFNALPNPDSIAPASDYVLADMIHIIETMEWKK